MSCGDGEFLLMLFGINRAIEDLRVGEGLVFH